LDKEEGAGDVTVTVDGVLVMTVAVEWAPETAAGGVVGAVFFNGGPEGGAVGVVAGEGRGAAVTSAADDGSDDEEKKGVVVVYAKDEAASVGNEVSPVAGALWVASNSDNEAVDSDEADVVVVDGPKTAAPPLIAR
jgi:hypothetical protein